MADQLMFIAGPDGQPIQVAPNGLDSDYLKKLEASSGGSSAPQPEAFVPDYNTVASTQKSILLNPQEQKSDSARQYYLKKLLENQAYNERMLARDLPNVGQSMVFQGPSVVPSTLLNPQGHLKKLEALSNGSSAPQPEPFVPDYNTVASTQNSMLLDPRTSTAGKSYVLDQLDAQEQKSDSARQLAFSKERQTDLENQAYNERALARGLPLQPLSSAFQDQTQAQAPSNVSQSMMLQGSSVVPSAAPRVERPNILERGFNLQRRSINEAEQAGVNRANEEAAYRDQIAKNLEDLEAKRQAAEAKRQQVVSDGMSKYQAMQNDIANQKIDPERLIGGGLNKILAALVVGVGQYAAMRSGTANAAMNIINEGINRDIDAQKTALSNKKTALESQSNLLGQMRQQVGDERAAESAAKMAYLDIAKQKLDGISAKFQAPEMKAKADQMRGALDVEYQKTQMDFARSLSEIGAKQASMELAKNDFYVDGLGMARTKEGAQKIRELKGDVDSGKQAIDRLVELSNKAGKSFNPADRAEAAVHIQNLIGLLRLPFTGPGALTETERDALKSVIGDPTKIFALDSIERKKLSTLATSLDDKLKLQARAQGIDVAPPTGSSAEKDRMRQYAMQNPNDPRSKQILQLLGQ